LLAMKPAINPRMIQVIQCMAQPPWESLGARRGPMPVATLDRGAECCGMDAQKASS
jgi:hypothetical protein